MGEISWNLAMSSLEKQKMVRDRWLPLNLMKEIHHGSYSGRPFQFAKAAGCRQVTVIQELSEGQETCSHLRDYRRPYDKKKYFHKRVEFLSAIQSTFDQQEYGAFEKEKNGIIITTNTDDEQIFPARGSDISVLPARHQRYHDLVVSLYRTYFSQDMHFIFPLMVYKQQQFSLDFSSTETTLVFDEIPKEGPINLLTNAPYYWRRLPPLPDDFPAPKGAVSWRFHQYNINYWAASPPEPLLEVMFIAVWEENRGQKLGSMLVEDLEKQALEKGIMLLYVEIGFEQPKAKEFWGKNGFKPIIEKFSDTKEAVLEDENNIFFSNQQKMYCDTVCLRFSDTEQWGKLIRASSSTGKSARK